MKKVDAVEIEDHVKHLTEQAWLGNRKWWPNFVYHTTNLDNAVNILESGFLYSRELAISNGSLIKDIADTSVISSTDTKWKSYSRFYLRPKTPTLYQNEGVRPKSDVLNSAHCPVPICFMFHAKAMLTRDDSSFTNGNLGSSSVLVGNDATFYKALPFEKIFHEGQFVASDKSTIIFHRNAELIIPGQVGLENLHYISCRSNAEKETLIHLLTSNVIKKWKDRIGVPSRFILFNEERSFIREVIKTETTLTIKFNEQSKSTGPFQLCWGVKALIESGSYEKCEDDYNLGPDYQITLNSYSHKSFEFWVKLDGHLIYKNNFYSLVDIPF